MPPTSKPARIFRAECLDGAVEWHATTPHLTGTPALVWRLTVALPGFGNIAVTPTGPFIPRDTRDPLAVVAALSELYPARVNLSGDVPSMDFGIPDDAVA